MPASHCSDDSLDLNDLFDACAPRGYPDDRESNPIQMSFHAFCLKADALYVHLQEDTATEADEAFAAKEFYRFVLAGRSRTNENESCHVTLNACEDLPQNIQYEVSRDYDSVIGLSRDLPYNNHLELTPVPPFIYTLKMNNHMDGIAYSAVSSLHPSYCLKIYNKLHSSLDS